MSAPVDVLAAVRAYGRECTRDGQQTVGQRVGRTARTRHAFAKVEAALQQAKLRETVAIAELIEAHAELLAQVDAGTSADYRALQEHRVVRRSRAALHAVGGAK